MRHIFISPHLDDAIFSAGDLLLDLVKKKEKVLVITIFSSFGTYPLGSFARKILRNLNYSLENYARQRKNEDVKAMKKLGVAYQHMDFTDGAFRKAKKSRLGHILSPLGIGPQFVYPTRWQLFSGKISQSDLLIEKQILARLKKVVKKDDILYGPLAIGNHADHLITNKALSQLTNRKYYWVDQPYVYRLLSRLKLPQTTKPFRKAFEAESTDNKISLARCYTSQISSVFKGKIKFLPEQYYVKID